LETISVPVSIAPTNTSDFVNGEWSGDITILVTTTNVILRATDAAGASGTSGPFDVLEAFRYR